MTQITIEQSAAIAGSWIAYDPFYPNRERWKQCIHRALETEPSEIWTVKHQAYAHSLYKRELWEVWKGSDKLWRVQGPRAIVGFKSKRSAVKFAAGNKALQEAAR